MCPTMEIYTDRNIGFGGIYDRTGYSFFADGRGLPFKNDLLLHSDDKSNYFIIAISAVVRAVKLDYGTGLTLKLH